MDQNGILTGQGCIVCLLAVAGLIGKVIDGVPLIVAVLPVGNHFGRTIPVVVQVPEFPVFDVPLQISGLRSGEEGLIVK